MRIPRIYCPEPLQTGATLALSDSAAKHIQRVLRLQTNNPVTLFDGNDSQAEAIITQSNKQGVQVRIESVSHVSLRSPLHINLLQGISRGERMDYTIQKSVELGVSSIQPVFTERTMVQLTDKRLDKRLLHWQGVIISACEQCGRNDLPQLLKPVSLPELLATNIPGIKLLLSLQATNTLSKPSPDQPVTLLIGPEGGLSETEQTMAMDAGFDGVRLGQRILRTETAAITAIATLQALWGDLLS